MRKTSLFLLCAAAVFAQETDHPGTLMSGTATMSRNGVGYQFRYETVVEPPPARMSDVRLDGGLRGDHNVVHREMIDHVHHQYFGYDLAAVPGPGVDEYTVTISPLSVASMMQKVSANPVPLPRYPPPTIVKEGDTIALDLLESADGKQKVVDYIHVSRLPEATAATTTAEPRDYTPDDGTPTLNGNGMKVLVNGQTVSGVMGTTIKPGATLWVSARNQGRFILSLVPQAGFQKSGAIRDNVISFQAAGQQYEIRTQNPILGRKGAWNLYVLHDPTYQPKMDGISVGLDRLENLLPKR
jgi:hypothetical protein